MKLNGHFLSGIVVGGLVTGGVSFYLQSVSAAGSDAKVLLENDRVRVRQVSFQPGCTAWVAHACLCACGCDP